MIEYIVAKDNAEFVAAASLFQQYADWLKIDLCFQHFDEELADLKSAYPSSGGGIILCKENELFAGCVALRRIDENTAELKRMYVLDSYHNKGIGKKLLELAIAMAVKLNYKKIRLDTLSHMVPAINLYRKYGFYEIPPYYFNPQDTAVFFEKEL